MLLITLGFDLWHVIGFLVFISLTLIFGTYVITHAAHKDEVLNIFNLLDGQKFNNCSQHQKYHQAKLMEKRLASMPNVFVNLNNLINMQLTNVSLMYISNLNNYGLFIIFEICGLNFLIQYIKKYFVKV